MRAGLDYVNLIMISDMIAAFVLAILFFKLRNGSTDWLVRFLAMFFFAYFANGCFEFLTWSGHKWAVYAGRCPRTATIWLLLWCLIGRKPKSLPKHL